MPATPPTGTRPARGSRPRPAPADRLLTGTSSPPEAGAVVARPFYRQSGRGKHNGGRPWATTSEAGYNRKISCRSVGFSVAQASSLVLRKNPRRPGYHYGNGSREMAEAQKQVVSISYPLFSARGTPRALGQQH